MNYLTENNILHKYQSGFRSNRTTDTRSLCDLSDKSSDTI